jgi:hypothetical protein
VVDKTDLQQELPEAHLPLVERCGPYATASSISMSSRGTASLARSIQMRRISWWQKVYEELGC